MTIEEESLVIFRRLRDKAAELKKELASLEDKIKEKSIEFKEAAAQGDFSENAAYTQALEDLTKLNTQKATILISIDHIEAINGDINYVPKSYIGLYSTFRLKRLDNGDTSTWRVYPGFVSDIDRGIMSADCPIYQLFIDKEKGDIIETRNRVNGQTVKFEILEVY